MDNNLRIYNEARSVPREATKPFSNGRFSGTDINPMWRIKKLTELFGPAGIGWYYEVLSERCEEHGDVTIAVVDINLYVKDGGEWSKPIYGTGGNTIKSIKAKTGEVSVSDEGYKMALTDAISVACKSLGIAADIYFEKDARYGTKYDAYAEKARPTAAKEPVKAKGEGSNTTPAEKAAEPPKNAEKNTVDMTVCSDCGKPITKVGKYDIMTIASRTLAGHGRVLCWDCASKASMARKENNNA